MDKEQKEIVSAKTKPDEDIVINLKTEDEDESVRNLPDDEKEKVSKVKEKLREELGVEIMKEMERQEALEAKNKEANLPEEEIIEKPAEVVEEKKQKRELPKRQKKEEKVEEPKDPEAEAKRYSKFIEQYSTSKKEDITESLSGYGKYDSDLDFRINRKVKKVRFPLPKYAKILISCLSLVFVLIVGLGLGLWLYKAPPNVYLTNVTLSQPTLNNYYIVNNVYVGDSISYDNIYLNCEYSNGTIKQVELESSMVSVNSENLVQGVFINHGEVIATVNYMGNKLNLKYVVKEKVLSGIELFSINNIKVEANSTLDLADKVIINASYNSGEIIKKINLNDCTYKMSGMQEPESITNNSIEIGDLTAGNYVVEIAYSSFTLNLNITII